MDKKLTESQVSALIQRAREVRQHSYSPYSNFAVGAALLTPEGATFAGCNVENISLGLTICAERAAICAAVAQGHTSFVAVSIVADHGDQFVGPCGPCRQMLAEFGTDYEVYQAKLSGEYIKNTLKELLPQGFTPDWAKFPKKI